MSTQAEVQFQEVTGLEPPPDRQNLLTCNFTDEEIADVCAAFAEVGGDLGLYAAEAGIARICREWLASKKGAA